MGLLAGRRASVRCIYSVPKSADVLLSIGPRLTVQLANLVLGLTRRYISFLAASSYSTQHQQSEAVA